LGEPHTAGAANDDDILAFYSSSHVSLPSLNSRCERGLFLAL
jgi:hypothetical protein